MAHILLPIVTVQRDFCGVIKDVDEGIVPIDNFWISCYKPGESSVHAKVEVELDPVHRDLVRFRPTEADVDIVKTSSGNYSVACDTLYIPPTPVVLSTQDYSDSMRRQRITAFDVSPDSTRFAAGYLDGSVLIYPSTPLHSKQQQQINTSKRKLVSKPHASHVTSLTFFPSSLVLLSSGADFSLSILSAEFPSSWQESASGLGTPIHPVRVLRGHTRPITSTSILGLGRNILSSSMDSTLRLWDVPSGSVISSLYASSPVLCTCVGGRIPTPPDAEDLPTSELPPMDERETPEVGQSFVYAGLQTGSFEVFDLRTRSSVYKSTPTSSAPINAISYLPSQHLLASGSSDGVITIYDVRSLSSPLTSFRRNDANVTDLEFALPSLSQDTNNIDKDGYDVGLAISTSDGLPYVANLIPEGPGVKAELVGVDCDPVKSIRVRGGGVTGNTEMEVWTASDDAIVRRYVF